MFSLGLTELTLIALVILFVVTPKDLPQIMYGFGKLLKRLSYLRYSVTRHFDNFMEETDLKKEQEAAAKRSTTKPKKKS